MTKKRKSKANVSGRRDTDRMLVNQFKQAVREKNLKKAESAFAGIEKADRKGLKAELKQLKNEVRQDIKEAKRRARQAFDKTREVIEILSQGASQEPLGVAPILHSLDHESDALANQISKAKGTQLDKEAQNLNRLREQLIQARSILRKRQGEYDRMMVVPKKARVNIPWTAIFSVIGFLAVLLLVFFGGAFVFGRGSGQISFSYATPTPLPVAPTTTPTPTELPEPVQEGEEAAPVSIVKETVIVEVTPVGMAAGGITAITSVQDDGLLAAPPSELELCLEQELDLFLDFDGIEQFDLKKTPDDDCFRYTWLKPPGESIELSEQEPHFLSVVDKNNPEHILLKKKFLIDPDMFLVEFPGSEEKPLPVFPWFVDAKSAQELDVELIVKKIDPLQAPVVISLGDKTYEFDDELALPIPRDNLQTEIEGNEELGYMYRYQWTRAINDLSELPDGKYSLIFTLKNNPDNKIYIYFELEEIQNRYSAKVNYEQGIWVLIKPYLSSDRSEIIGYPLGVDTPVNIIGRLGFKKADDANDESESDFDMWCLFEYRKDDFVRGWTLCEYLILEDADKTWDEIPLIAQRIDRKYEDSGGVIGVETEE